MKKVLLVLVLLCCTNLANVQGVQGAEHPFVYNPHNPKFKGTLLSRDQMAEAIRTNNPKVFRPEAVRHIVAHFRDMIPDRNWDQQSVADFIASEVNEVLCTSVDGGRIHTASIDDQGRMQWKTRLCERGEMVYQFLKPGGGWVTLFMPGCGNPTKAAYTPPPVALAPRCLRIKADPQNVIEGEIIRVTWVTENATFARLFVGAHHYSDISVDSVASGGSNVNLPLGDHTIRLEIGGTQRQETLSCEVTVTVYAPPPVAPPQVDLCVALPAEVKKVTSIPGILLYVSAGDAETWRKCNPRIKKGDRDWLEGRGQCLSADSAALTARIKSILEPPSLTVFSGKGITMMPSARKHASIFADLNAGVGSRPPDNRFWHIPPSTLGGSISLVDGIP